MISVVRRCNQSHASKSLGGALAWVVSSVSINHIADEDLYFRGKALTHTRLHNIQERGIWALGEKIDSIVLCSFQPVSCSQIVPTPQTEMAEAAAFGLAVNILTVVDYGRQFAVSAWKIWKSGPDGLPGLTSLQEASQDLVGVTERLKETGRGSIGSDEDGRLLELANRCNAVARKILQTLGEVKIPEKEHGRILSSFSLFSHRETILNSAVAAFKLKWEESKIRELEEELETLKSEMMMNLAVSCR